MFLSCFDVLITKSSNQSIILMTTVLQVRPGEPVYAQVNRDKKRSRGSEMGGGGVGDYGDHSHHWVVQDTNGAVLDGHGGGGGGGPHQPPQGGDSWV